MMQPNLCFHGAPGNATWGRSNVTHGTTKGGACSAPISAQVAPSALQFHKNHARRPIGVAAGRGGGSGGYQRRAEAGDVDERGWWEKPEEVSMSAYAVEPLEPYQVEALETAYAEYGRRKMKVGNLHACLSHACWVHGLRLDTTTPVHAENGFSRQMPHMPFHWHDLHVCLPPCRTTIPHTISAQYWYPITLFNARNWLGPAPRSSRARKDAYVCLFGTIAGAAAG